MTFQRVADKAFGSRQVTLLAEEELDRGAHAIDGGVKIHPATAHSDVSFINVALASDRTLPCGLRQSRRLRTAWHSIRCAPANTILSKKYLRKISTDVEAQKIGD